jgi:hypothetical protein
MNTSEQELREGLTKERLETEKHQQQALERAIESLETIPKQTNELSREMITQDRLEQEHDQQVVLQRSMEQLESANPE